MIVRIYIKGNFRANYTAVLSGGNPELHRTYSHIRFKDKWLTEAEKIPGYSSSLLTREPYYECPNLKDVYVSMKGEAPDIFFDEDFEDVVINEIVIRKSDVAKDEASFQGVFYGTLVVTKPDPPKVELKTKPGNANSGMVPSGRGVSGPSKEGDSSYGNGDEIQHTDESAVFSKPWEPDDFLANYGISPLQWKSWKERWKNNWINIALCLLGIFVLLSSGLLAIPLMWIPFILLVKAAGDGIVRVISPGLASRQAASALNVSSGRRMLRAIYLFTLLTLFVYFLVKKLGLFAALAGVLVLLHLFTYGSPLIFSIRRIFHVTSLLLVLFAVVRTVDRVNEKRPAPRLADQGDSELIPDRTDSTQAKNQFTLNWQDYAKNSYSGTYSVPKSSFVQSYNNRNALRPSNGIVEVYTNVYRNDKVSLQGIIAMFDRIKKEKNLNPVQFAEMAGTFVQRIPYVLVHDLSCAQLVRENYNDKFIQQYHRDGGQCLQNCKFGLQAPVEFSYNLKGDCDTRSLLLYTILDHYGYDVAVFISNVYSHCILGIGLPYKGLFKSYQGVRYYAWELTAADWQPGLLPPQISGMNNWEIALVNK